MNNLPLLEEELLKLRKENEQLKNINYQKENLNNIMKNRIGFVLSFIRFLKEGKYTEHSTSHIMPSIKSSFIKNMFETLIHQTTNLTNIELVYTTAPVNDTKLMFNQLCQYFELCLSVGSQTGIKCIPSFNFYKTISSSYTEENITMEFANEFDKFNLVIYLCNTDFGNYTSDVLMASSIGISSIRTGVDFFESLESIYFKEYKICNSLINMQSYSSSLPIATKVKCLKQIYNLIGKQMISKYFNGYTLTGVKPIFHIEEKLDCPITGHNAPYPAFALKCKHKLSFMAYKGLLNSPNSDPNCFLRCPFCRDNLEIKMETIPSSSIPCFATRISNSTSSTNQIQQLFNSDVLNQI